MEINSNLSAVSLKDRYISLDVLRGFAVLGILVMNIQNFSMIPAAYINPPDYGLAQEKDSIFTNVKQINLPGIRLLMDCQAM